MFLNSTNKFLPFIPAPIAQTDSSSEISIIFSLKSWNFEIGLKVAEHERDFYIKSHYLSCTLGEIPKQAQTRNSKVCSVNVINNSVAHSITSKHL